MGVLYLENNLATGAFTAERIETLQLLTSQAAIALENAQLYQAVANHSQTLEAEVARKTEDLHQQAQDLEQTLQQLRRTQAQLVQTEKMSSLGQMVAGVAHEINNPINFIHGNVNHAGRYFADLLELINLYRQEVPQPQSIALQENLDDLDLEFLTQDIQSMLNSVATGSARISQIVLSLRNFSRLDESSFKPVNLHEGLDSTLLVLQNRLQASAAAPAIQVCKNYGELPLLLCEANQINQVFLNIISNAIDAMRDKLAPDCLPPQLRIATETKADGQLCITIANNGSPIPDDVQGQIFDPFFTTKPVGQGTGLGLSVSYSIIEQHGGTIAVQSSLEQGTTFTITLPSNT